MRKPPRTLTQLYSPEHLSMLCD